MSAAKEVQRVTYTIECTKADSIMPHTKVGDVVAIGHDKEQVREIGSALAENGADVEGFDIEYMLHTRTLH
jgi:hypothetical protein